MALGLLLIGLGLWGLLFFLPRAEPQTTSEAPTSPNPRAEFPAARLEPEEYQAGQVASFGLIACGLLAAIAGACYRAQAEATCRRCKRRVIGWKRPFGLQCPLDRHYAQINWFAAFTAILVWGTAIGLAGTLAYLILP
jgi:hypothetical protein